MYLLKGIDDDGKAIWEEINATPQDTIREILTQCGSTTPDVDGKITHTGKCGARVVDDDCEDLCITLNTEWGLQGGGNVCAGESLTLGLDLENTDLVTSSSKDVKDGDSVVFDGTSGKIIKRAMNWRVGDGTDSWTGRFNPDDKSFQIFPNQMSDKPIIQMLNNGVILQPWQPKCSVKLEQTPQFPANTELELGSNKSFIKIRDEDGYNTSANNFFVGGSGKRAYYKAPYTGSYFVKYQFLVDSGETTTNNIYMYVKIFWGKDGGDELSAYNWNRFATPSYITMSDSGIIFLEKGDIIHINVRVNGGNPYIAVRNPSEKTVENYWEIVFLG